MALTDKIKPSAPRYSMEQLIAELLQSAVEIHKAHFATKSFARHKAFDEYYSDIVGLTDRLTESYQGLIGIITIPKAKIEMADPLQYLTSVNSYLHEVYMFQSSGAIRAIIDEIEELILTTLYKLNNLS